jgi:hypothetical protein
MHDGGTVASIRRDQDIPFGQVQFEKNIRSSFEDPDNVRWTDENVMLTVRQD